MRGVVIVLIAYWGWIAVAADDALVAAEAAGLEAALIGVCAAGAAWLHRR